MRSLPLDFLQYGVLGLVILALVAGWLWTKPAVEQLRADNTRVIAQRDALIDTYEKQVIPVLAEVQRELVPAVTEIATMMRGLQSGGERDVRVLLNEARALRRDIAELQKVLAQTDGRSRR